MLVRWQIATIEAAGHSTQSSVAFSPTGRAAVAYYSSTHNALRYAIETAGPLWDISTVETVPADCKPSLAFRLGRPAISYRVGAGAEGGELRFAAQGNTGGWSISSVAPSGDASSLAFDPSHDPAISYYEPITKRLKLARSTTPSVWVSQTVDEREGVGDFNALAFSPATQTIYNGQPAIAYHVRAAMNGKLSYAAFTGTTWHKQTVSQGIGAGPGVGRCSLAFGPFGSPTVVVGGSGYVNVYDYDSGIGWLGAGSSFARSGSVAYNPARAFERGVSYDYDGSVRYSLGFAGRLGRLLVEAPGKNQAGDLIGPFELTATAFSSTGRPAISYYDTSNYTIKIALGTIVRLPIDYVTESFDTLLRYGMRIIRMFHRPPAPTEPASNA